MNLEHEFTVPVPVDEAWKVLLDVERVAPCMPGATLLSVDGDDFTGTVKVKVGPIQVTYKGNATFASKDDASHVAVIEASGKEARGSGTASATVTATLHAEGSSTKVRVGTDLNVTGRPAQFGRGVMAEVAAKLINQFATCLADELSAAPTAQSPAPAPADAAAASPSTATESAAPEPVQTDAAPSLPPTPAGMTEPAPAPAAPVPGATSSTSSAGAPTSTPRRTPEAIDLLDVAGGSVAKRLVPLVAALAFVVLLWRRRRR